LVQKNNPERKGKVAKKLAFRKVAEPVKRKGKKGRRGNRTPCCR